MDIQKLIDKYEKRKIRFYTDTGEAEICREIISDLKAYQKSLTVEGEKNILADIMQNMIDNGVMLNQQQSRAIRQAYQDSLKDKPDINLEL